MLFLCLHIELDALYLSTHRTHSILTKSYYWLFASFFGMLTLSAFPSWICLCSMLQSELEKNVIRYLTAVKIFSHDSLDRLLPLKIYNDTLSPKLQYKALRNSQMYQAFSTTLIIHQQERLIFQRLPIETQCSKAAKKEVTSICVSGHSGVLPLVITQPGTSYFWYLDMDIHIDGARPVLSARSLY